MAITAAASQQPTPDLFELFPHETRFRLRPRDGQKRGDQVLLPVHVQHADSVVLAGSCDLNEVNAMLADEDLEASPVESVSVMLNIEHISKSDVGAYCEVMLLVNVVNKPPRGSRLGKQQGAFTWQVFVSEDLPLRVGQQVWGSPKSLASLQYDRGDNGIIFSASQDEQLQFRGRCPAIPTQAGPLQQVVTITPYADRRTWQRVISVSNTGMRLFAPTDEFEFDDSSAMGSKLASIGFVPMAWLHYENTRLVGFADDRPRELP